MRLPPLPAACLAVLLLGLAWTLPGLRATGGPVGEEATTVLITQSLLHDRDLTYAEEDLRRASQVWDQGPAGVTLFTNDGGTTLRYGRPWVYPLAAVPFYALLGPPGLAVLNMLLFLGMTAAAFAAFREEPGPVGLFLAGFFFASVSFAYAFRLEPVVFTMACVFFPLLLARRLRGRPPGERPGRRDLMLLAAAGALVALAGLTSPPAAVPGLAVLLDLLLGRRLKAALAFAAAALLTFGLASAAQRAATGEWTSWGGDQRRTFAAEYPLESRRDLWQAQAGAGDRTPSPGVGVAARLLPRNLWYLLVGRHGGLVPYLPFAVLALALAPWGPPDRLRRFLLAALLAVALGLLLLHPYDFLGGPGALGNRSLAALYPAFLFLPGRLAVRRALVLPFAAAGLWTASIIIAPIAPAAPAFQALPLELTLLRGGLPGLAVQAWKDEVWILPRRDFSVEERHPNGVWLRGAARAEAFAVSPEPLEELHLRVHSLSEVNTLTLDGGAGPVRVTFDTEGKRTGTPITLRLDPVARDLGFLPGAPGETFYRITFTTTDGVVPARSYPKNGDLRNLGVFLDFTGGGY